MSESFIISYCYMSIPRGIMMFISVDVSIARGIMMFILCIAYVRVMSVCVDVSIAWGILMFIWVST